MKLFALLTVLAASLVATPQTQAQTFAWTNIDGGDFNDPANWNPFGGPGPGDRAVFDLAGYRYFVLSNFTDLDGTTVGRSDVGFIPYDDATFQFGMLEIVGGDLPSGDVDLLRPGRLRLLGDGLSKASDVVVGRGSRPSQLVLGEEHPLDTDRYLQSNAAALTFKLAANATDDPASPRLRVTQEGEYRGSVNVRPTSGGYPAQGTVVNLLQSLPGFKPEDLQLLLVQDKGGRTIDLSVEFDPGRLLASVDVVDEIVDLQQLDADVVDEDPVSLAAADLNDDFVPDLLVLLPSGKLLAYPGSTGGGFLGPIEYSVGSGPVGMAIDDFDQDGTNDVAVVSTGKNLLELLLNPSADLNALTTGPTLLLENEPVSIAPIVFPASGSNLTDSETGVAVTGKNSTGKGKTTPLKTGRDNIEKAGESDVGDEPGPTDPIDDEGKKEDSTDAVGVGGTSSALTGSVPVLQVLEILPIDAGGIQPLRSIPLSGQAVDLASGDVDGDGVLDTFVVTSNGQLNHTTPLVSGAVARSIPLSGSPRAIAIADLDLDGLEEIVIALNGSSFLSVLKAVPAPVGAPAGQLGLVLKEIARIPTDRFTLDIVAIPADTIGFPGRVVSGLRATGVSDPLVEIRGYDASPVPPCVFADLNGDDVVNGADMGTLFAFWGRCPSCAADLNGDGNVDSADLGLLFISWGPCDG